MIVLRLVYPDGRTETVGVESAVRLADCEHCGDPFEDEIVEVRKYCRASHRIRASERRTSERESGGFTFIA